MRKFSGNFSSDSSEARYLASLGEVDFGEFILGSNTTKILYEDPKLLLFSLAIYNFVAILFSNFYKILYDDHPYP